MTKSTDRAAFSLLWWCIVVVALGWSWDATPQAQPAPKLKGKLGLVEPRGPVTVNGDAIRVLQALFPGDKVQTAAGGRAIIELVHSTAVLAAKSCGIYGPNFLEITCGTASVTTKTRMTILVCRLSVVPQQDEADFVAGISSGFVVVLARRGALRLETPQEHSVLGAGGTFTRATSELCR